MNNQKTLLVNAKIIDQFSNIVNELGEVKKMCTRLQNEVRQLQNKVEKNNRNKEKELFKHKQKGNRKPSGFAKPSNVTDELCKFCLLYTSPSPRDGTKSRMPSSA